MDQTALVAFEMERGKRVLDALDRAGVSPEVALWALLPQYEDWRFILSSSHIHGYEEMVEKLRAAGVMPDSRPSILLREIDDPFIRELRETYAERGLEPGHPLPGLYFNKQFVEEAYSYRIR